jgi:hypothetical protein
MSTDFSIKPVGSPVSTPIVQPVSAAAANATATQLPPSQSVTASSGSTPVRNNPSPVNLNISDVAFLDRDAGSVVFQTVNTSTGAVINQFPDDAMLRRLAYFRAQDLAKENSPNGAATDRNA